MLKVSPRRFEPMKEIGKIKKPPVIKLAAAGGSPPPPPPPLDPDKIFKKPMSAEMINQIETLCNNTKNHFLNMIYKK